MNCDFSKGCQFPLVPVKLFEMFSRTIQTSLFPRRCNSYLKTRNSTGPGVPLLSGEPSLWLSDLILVLSVEGWTFPGADSLPWVPMGVRGSWAKGLVSFKGWKQKMKGVSFSGRAVSAFRPCPQCLVLIILPRDDHLGPHQLDPTNAALTGAAYTAQGKLKAFWGYLCLASLEALVGGFLIVLKVNSLTKFQVKKTVSK